MQVLSSGSRRDPWRLLTAVMVSLGICGCAMGPVEREALSEEKVDGVRKTLEAFRADERLGPFFEEAEVIAVYPFSARGANGVGLAYGSGLVFDQTSTVIGRTRMWQISMGPQIGGQLYRQVLFFRTLEAYERFVASPAEFAGQFNAAAATLGVSSTPSFQSDVALFTELHGGLLLEASVAANRYTFGAVTD